MMTSQTQTQSGYSSYGQYLYGAFLSILTFVVGAILLFYLVSQFVEKILHLKFLVAVDGARRED